MNSYQNVLNGNNELNKKSRRLTWTELAIIVFFSLYAMFPSNQGVLYAGFGIVFTSVFLSILFNSKGDNIQIPVMCTRLLIFSFFSLASVLWAIDPRLVYRYMVITLLSAFLTVILVSYLLQRESENVIFIALAVVGISLAIFVIVSYGGLSAFYNSAVEKDARLGGDINNVNSIGMQCAYSAIVIFGYALFFQKNIYYVFFLIPSMVAAASGSRKAMLVIILGVILLVYYKQQEDKTIKKYLKYIVFVIIGILLLIYILQLPIMATFAKRFGQMMDFYGGSGEADESTRIRNEMISLGFKQFLYKPFLGIGLRNTEILYSVKINFASYSHNDYIELLVNGGIVGFLLYYSIYFYLVKNYLKILKKDTDPKSRIAFVLLVNFLIMNWGNVTYYGNISTFLYLALWISHVELKKKQGII